MHNINVTINSTESELRYVEDGLGTDTPHVNHILASDSHIIKWHSSSEDALIRFSISPGEYEETKAWAWSFPVSIQGTCDLVVV